MTNGIALGLGLFIAALLGIDAYLNDSTASLFLARKGVELLEWVAFWR